MAGWSPLAMAEWIEILMPIPVILPPLSPLAMAEWIEIELKEINFELYAVSASDGGVD